MIDKSTIEQARQADMIAFLEKRCGFTFAPVGGAYRCKEHKSLAVKADRLSWYWHSQGAGGFGALDYLTKIEKMPFRQAVEVAAGVAAIPTPPPLLENPITVKPKTLILPEKAGMPLKLYDYLCIKRGIDSEIVNRLIQKEQLYEDRRGNVVFVGYDEQGAARFASLRGTHGDFRGDCAGSDKRYGFAMVACAPSDRLYIFESPIDCMSHASLVNAATGGTGAWKRHSRLSLSGTSDTALPFFLKQHTAVHALVFCLDNDTAGQAAAADMARKYAGQGYKVRIERPQGKDFNEDLTAFTAEKSSRERGKFQHIDVSF
jgi:hypothetical protein